MELTFEHNQYICDGSNPAGYHMPDNSFFVYHIDGEQVQVVDAYPELGVYDALVWSAAELVSSDTEVQSLSIHYLPNYRRWYAWQLISSSVHRLTVVPDEEIEITESAYKLYYAHDLEKLYLNMNELWHFIGTIRHGLLKEIGEDQHTQYLTHTRHEEAHQDRSGPVLPTATSAHRGLFYLLTNDVVDDDLLYVCIREAAGTYAWREVTIV